MINKIEIYQYLLDKTATDLAQAKIASQKSLQLANHPEMKQEGKHDTRKTEANYLAGALKERELKLASDYDILLQLDPKSQSLTIRIGSLVICQENEKESIFYISPATGGDSVKINSKMIKILSVTSPLATQMISLSLEDEFEFFIMGKTKEYIIKAIH